jgi:ABC-type enterochelin transport system permease subunit
MNPPSLQRRKAAAKFSLKVMGVLRYKMSLCQWMYKEKGTSLTFLILLFVIYKNGCCVHLRLLSAVKDYCAGEHYLHVMDCNRTLALIF